MSWICGRSTHDFLFSKQTEAFSSGPSSSHATLAHGAWEKLMTEHESSSIGAFVANALVVGKLRVVETKNAAGYAAVIPEVARAVMEKYPTLSAEERAAVFAILKAEAESLRTTNGIDATMALQSARRILKS